MKAKKIQESVNFERGNNPMDSMDIGYDKIEFWVQRNKFNFDFDLFLKYLDSLKGKKISGKFKKNRDTEYESYEFIIRDYSYYNKKLVFFNIGNDYIADFYETYYISKRYFE